MDSGPHPWEEELLFHGGLYKLRVYGVAISVGYRLHSLVEITSCIASSSLLRRTLLFCPILKTFLCLCCKHGQFRTICLETWER